MSQKIKQLKTGPKCLDLSNKIKKINFIETQIVRALKEGEEGRKTDDVHPIKIISIEASGYSTERIA